VPLLGVDPTGRAAFKVLVRGNLSEALGDEPEIVARVFAALGSPFRVRLLRALLEGPRTGQELQAGLASVRWGSSTTTSRSCWRPG
jgi:hypothetical protein